MIQVKSSVTQGHLPPRLARLEAEGIGIIREVAASFRNPVLLYSIGKDSSVVLQLALKAFHPGKPPFPLLHIATGWDFQEMLAFRDRRVANSGCSSRCTPIRKAWRAASAWSPRAPRCTCRSWPPRR